MDRPLYILNVEDNPNDSELIQATLGADGLSCEVVRVQTREDFETHLDRGYDLILCDYSLPNFDGRAALALAQAKQCQAPFIYVSGTIGEETAVESLKAGATDYILKDRLTRLPHAVRRALQEKEESAARKQAERKAHWLAYYDPLTGLPNRATLCDHLRELISLGRPEPISVVIIDLDRFTEINNTLGYEIGDLLLQQTASRLRSLLETNDMLGRLSGDDFVAVIQGSVDKLDQLRQTMLHALRKSFWLGILTLEIEPRIGVAVYPDHGHKPEELIQHAEVALYLSKQEGLDYLVYRPDHDPFDPDRLTLQQELREAIEADRLVLHYQPKVALRSGHVVGVEALVRWPHDRRGLMMPDQFIPLAEKTGLIRNLTLWVLRQALQQQKLWRETGFDLEIAVNISARNLLDFSACDAIDALIRQFQVPPAQLTVVLELTESAFVGDPVRALEQALRLARIGARISIDDFGTGYSSFAYLKQLPVTELKIDKRFVQGFMQNAQDAAIVRASIELGHAFGLNVVAEGIEDQQTWHGLMALGCDMGQGYYLSRPVPASSLEGWLEQRR